VSALVNVAATLSASPGWRVECFWRLNGYGLRVRERQQSPEQDQQNV
jgi:hypothetical protein